MTNLEQVIDSGSKIIKNDFGLSTEKTSIKAYDSELWNLFCKTNNFNKDSEGAYIPKSNIAYVNSDSKHLITNAFHEFFGHGIYCENSVIGRPLSELNSKDEREQFLFDQETAKNQLFGIANTNFGNYEGFALWIEKYLCDKTGNTAIWTSKKNMLPREYSELSEYFDQADDTLTSFGLIAQMGLPKHYTNEKLLNTLFHISQNRLKESTIILYGSKKPYSDIDLFIISGNNSNNYFNGWLDIYELNFEDFKNKARHFDISVTDPLFSGKVIFGNEKFVEDSKIKILSDAITDEAIKYNYGMSDQQKNFMNKFEPGSREYVIGKKYVESYKNNALSLSKGIKPLTYLKNQSLSSLSDN